MNVIITGSWDSTLKLWDPRQQREAGTYQQSHKVSVMQYTLLLLKKILTKFLIFHHYIFLEYALIWEEILLYMQISARDKMFLLCEKLIYFYHYVIHVYYSFVASLLGRRSNDSSGKSRCIMIIMLYC